MSGLVYGQSDVCCKATDKWMCSHFQKFSEKRCYTKTQTKQINYMSHHLSQPIYLGKQA